MKITIPTKGLSDVIYNEGERRAAGKGVAVFRGTVSAWRYFEAASAAFAPRKRRVDRGFYPLSLATSCARGLSHRGLCPGPF